MASYGLENSRVYSSGALKNIVVFDADLFLFSFFSISTVELSRRGFSKM
jgi:hypothetical protein